MPSVNYALALAHAERKGETKGNMFVVEDKRATHICLHIWGVPFRPADMFAQPVGGASNPTTSDGHILHLREEMEDQRNRVLCLKD